MPLGNNLQLSKLMPETANMNLGIPDMSLGPITVNGNIGHIHADTVVMAWATMAIVLVGAKVLAPRLVAAGPGSSGQGLLEMIYSFVEDVTKGQIGHDYKKFFPLIAAIFIFVLIGNFIGVGPWKFFETMPWWQEKFGHHFELASPTTDFNVTFGLAVVSLLTYLGAGFWAHGAKYLKLYLNPIEWLDLIIRPATLALRLMMVITADELMRAAAIAMVPMLLPSGVMAFELFIGVIQAFVFALLTAIYIGLTVSHH